MDTSQDQYTLLLLKYGAIQTSPEQAKLLNTQEVIAFASRTDAITNPSGYQVKLTGYASYISEQESNSNTYLDLEDLLTSLRSTPRAPNSKKLKGSVSTFSLSNDAYRIDYRIANGEVVVYNIQPIDKLQLQRDRLEKAALYRVKRNSQGVWQVAGRVESITTQFAAVNGQSNNLTKATWLMGQHLEFQFKSLQEYTLFHNPSDGGKWDTWESMRDKFGVTTAVTKKFAKILSDTQAKGNSTQWVAHSQGGVIFAEGVRYLLNGSSSFALHKFQLNGINNAEKGKLLDRHSVSFHANANNNLRSKLLLDRAGITVLPSQSTDYDFVHKIIGLNSVNPRKLIGAVIYSSHVFSGSVAQSPHTLAQTPEQWRENMDKGPGKGRNVIQKAFNALDKPIKFKKAKPNYLP